jgi:AraC-like DNA-binding protein/quercetin dioxygenase-like cupin family protein
VNRNRTEPPAFISRQIREGSYLFLHLQPDPAAALVVVCVGRETCAEDYRVRRHRFPYWAVEYVTAGAGVFTADGRTSELGAGSVIAYGPETPHEIRAHGPHLTKYFIDFAGCGARERLASSGLPPGRHRLLATRRWIHDLFDQLLDCRRLPRESAALLAPLLAEALLLRLAEQPAPGLGTHQARETFQRCRDYLRTHFRRLQTVEEVGRACALSQPYVARLFKTHAAETPYQYLTRLKMTEAADLLLHEPIGVKAVAARVGFADPYHFSRAFKRFHGASPSAYREAFHRA